MLPYDYTSIWAHNFPYPGPQVVNAVSHRCDGESLLLKTESSGDVAFVEPLEWWREESSMHGGDVLQFLDFFEKSTADFVYTFASRHAGRVVRVVAGADAEDGGRFQLLLSGKVEAQFDRPGKWSRHKRLGKAG